MGKNKANLFISMFFIIFSILTILVFQNCGEVHLQSRNFPSNPNPVPGPGPFKVTLNLLAGDTGGPGNFDGQGSAARFAYPNDIVADNLGNIYVADAGNNTIRKITAAGIVSTIAGLAGTTGSTNGQGALARFNDPNGIAVDIQGNIFVADRLNHTIRKITSSGTVSTIAGLPGNYGYTDGPVSVAKFYQPRGLAIDDQGNIYVADTFNNTIRKITAAGIVSTIAGLAGYFGYADGPAANSKFNFPRGLTLDTQGNIYVADTFNNAIRKITPTGTVSTIAGYNGAGNLDGSVSVARFNFPSGVAVDAGGNIFVADNQSRTIRKINSSGIVSTITGSLGYLDSAMGLQGRAAKFDHPNGVATDKYGTIFIADAVYHVIRKISSSGIVSTVAGLAGAAGREDGSSPEAKFYNPVGMASDAKGNIFVADTENHTIRKITISGAVSTIAGSAGNIGSSNGMALEAKFSFPFGIAMDADENIYVADTYNHVIRKITSGGVVSTFAGKVGSNGFADGQGADARFDTPMGLAADAQGNIYVANSGNNTIRKITSSGIVSTIAGRAGFFEGSTDGPVAVAKFYYPRGIAVDTSGNIFVTDTGNHTIRKISSSGIVSTVAGAAGVIGSEDGQGALARFNHPVGITIDAQGNIYVADSNNHTIRKINSSGVVSTIIGQVGKIKIGIQEELPSTLTYPMGVVVGDKFIFITNVNSVVVAPLP